MIIGPSLFCFLRAEQESKITSEKDEHIKTVESEILQLKADIYNLKVLNVLCLTFISKGNIFVISHFQDVYRKYSMYGKFLAAISPEDWRKEQVYIVDNLSILDIF